MWQPNILFILQKVNHSKLLLQMSLHFQVLQLLLIPETFVPSFVEAQHYVFIYIKKRE